MKLIEFKLQSTGRVFVNPNNVAYVEGFTQNDCTIHFIGEKDKSVWVPLSAESVRQSLELGR